MIESKSKSESRVFIQSSNAFNSYPYAELKPGARKSSWISHMGDKDSGTWTLEPSPAASADAETIQNWRSLDTLT